MGGARSTCKSELKNLENYIHSHNKIKLGSFFKCDDCVEDTNLLCKAHVKQILQIGHGWEITFFLFNRGELTHKMIQANIMDQAITIYGRKEAGLKIQNGIRIMKERQSKRQLGYTLAKLKQEYDKLTVIEEREVRAYKQQLSRRKEVQVYSMLEEIVIFCSACAFVFVIVWLFPVGAVDAKAIPDINSCKTSKSCARAQVAITENLIENLAAQLNQTAADIIAKGIK